MALAPANVVSCASNAWTSLPIATPSAVRAADAEVAPVPPSPIASVPVIADAPKSTANSVDSITQPPLAFRSTLTVEPTTSIPSPAATLEPPAAEIVIEPLPSVIVMFDPAVSVDNA